MQEEYWQKARFSNDFFYIITNVGRHEITLVVRKNLYG